jgi:DNA-binding transcriptional LysR family regulator
MLVNLAAIDLKLLVVFDAVMAERNVTRAGRRLGMSQPALSNALARARHLLKDQLFVRGADGMQPTPRALALAVPVREALRQLETTLEPPGFNPTETEWEFKLGMSDHASIVLLPALLRHVAALAPGVRLNVLPKANDTVGAALTAGELDLAIGVIPALPRQFSRLDLFVDDYVCLMRADHRLANGGLTRRHYAAAEHLALRPSYAGRSGIDNLAQQAGVQRHIALAVNQFLAVAPLVRATDLLASLFRRMTEHVDQTGLLVRPIPFPATRVPVAAVWNRTQTSHVAHRWLRLRLAEVAERMDQAA